MAKLPDINYLTPTETLGRESIALPGKVARAQIELNQTLTGMLTSGVSAYMEQQVSEGVAGAQSELANLKEQLMMNRTIDADQWGLTEGQAVRADVNGEPLESVSSWQHMEQLWGDGVRNIMSKYTTGMAPGQRRAVMNKLAGSVQKMGGMVTAQARKWQMDEYNAVTEEQAQKLINSASFENKDEVKMQVESTYLGMIRSGFMSAEEGMKRIRGARSRVDYQVTSRLIVDGGQTEIDQVEELLAAPAEEGGLELTLEQRKGLYQQIDVKQGRLERAREKAETEARNKAAVDTIIDIRDEGPMAWNDLREKVKDFEPSDARLIAALNDAQIKEQKQEALTSDPVILAQLEADILLAQLTPYSNDDVTPNIMYDALMNKITAKLHDFATEQKGITANDAASLAGRVKSMTQTRMKPPGTDQALDWGALKITKMSRNQLGMNNTGAAASRYADYEQDLLNGIRTGAIRDPWAWTQQNIENYLSGTAVTNMRKADVEIAEQFKVMSDPESAAARAGIPINFTASIQMAKDAYKAGRIDRKVYQMTVDYWRDQRSSYIRALPTE